MKVTELMVGDWVSQCELNVPVKVQSIMCYYGDGNVYFYHDARDYISNVSKLNPIPLTKEIMEKNGFNLYPEETNVFYLNFGYRHDLDTVCLYIGEIERPSIYGNETIGEKTYVVLHCKYVHELQHLLKLCKIEKEIIL